MSTLARLYAKKVMGVQRQACRAFFTSRKDRVLSEEERALENVYIQKMERERLEKLWKKMEKEKSGSIKTKGSAENISADEGEHRHAAG